MRNKFLLVVLGVLLPAAGVLLPAAAVAGPIVSPITSLVVFGDSLVDQGNASALTGGTFPPAPYAGVASNGPVAVQQLAARLGVSLEASTSGGTNYAVVGAATGQVEIPGTGGITTENFSAVTYAQAALEGTGILTQVGSYLASAPVLDPEQSLFFLWGGGNDLFLDASAASAINAVRNLTEALTQLYLAGGRRFMVPNLADFASSPFGLSLPPAQQVLLHQLTLGFNGILATALSELGRLPGIDLLAFDSFSLLNEVVRDPASFGLTNVTEACLSGDLGIPGSVCSDPDSYLFWDSVHPTTRAHTLLGDAFARAVPEPAVSLLLTLGVGGSALIVLRRRTRRARPQRY